MAAKARGGAATMTKGSFPWSSHHDPIRRGMYA
jgi:hypothetical protein